MAEAVLSLHDARRRATTAQSDREDQAAKSCSIFCTITNTHQAQSSELRENSLIKVAAPTTANRTLRRLPNASYRPREYLTEAEVGRLIEAARKRGRNSARDVAAIMLAYRHGLRAAELCSLR